MVTHTHIHTHTYTHDNYYNPRCAHAHRGLTRAVLTVIVLALLVVIVNPWRACTARVMVVVLCVCVCLCVCLSAQAILAARYSGSTSD